LKIRKGFVSNSSSSSFTIISKNGKEVTEEMLERAISFDIDAMKNEMAGIFMTKMGDAKRLKNKAKSFSGWISDYGDGADSDLEAFMRGHVNFEYEDDEIKFKAGDFDED
jgi:hypothetical protein